MFNIKSISHKIPKPCKKLLFKTAEGKRILNEFRSCPMKFFTQMGKETWFADISYDEFDAFLFHVSMKFHTVDDKEEYLFIQEVLKETKKDFNYVKQRLLTVKPYYGQYVHKDLGYFLVRAFLLSK